MGRPRLGPVCLGLAASFVPPADPKAVAGSPAYEYGLNDGSLKEVIMLILTNKDGLFPNFFIQNVVFIVFEKYTPCAAFGGAAARRRPEEGVLLPNISKTDFVFRYLEQRPIHLFQH